MTPWKVLDTRQFISDGRHWGKVASVLFLTEHHTMKAYRGVEVQLDAFFDLGTRWR
jgi:hypothetical protein